MSVNALPSALEGLSVPSPTPHSTTVVGTTRFSALRKLITSPELSFLMEAHNGMSARIVEEAGFRGIWASGLTISASLGLRDSNEASWTQVLEILEYMADSTTLPILVDGDTGHGNFNNVRRFVRKLCDRHIAGVCIEDKLFPKTNSFIGDAQPLANIEEFCGRIKAGKDSQTDDDFVFVARVEALISGQGMREALARAQAYYNAGADAILIHSKQNTASEVLTFAAEWGNRCPLVIVPTMYYTTPVQQFEQARISTVIWANHLLRASLTAMRETAQLIETTSSLQEIEARIAPVKEVFRLAGNAELDRAERKYLPDPESPKAVILAASRGDLPELTRDRPKCMVDVRGRPLLSRLVSTFNDCGISDVFVVRGYKKESITDARILPVDNDHYEFTGEVGSLACAADRLSAETVVAYGDVLFRRYILDSILGCEADAVIAVDGCKNNYDGETRDWISADHPYVVSDLDERIVRLTALGSDVVKSGVTGHWIGLARFSKKGMAWLHEELELLRAEGHLTTTDMPQLISRIATRHEVRVLYFASDWINLSTLTDLAQARNFV